MTAATTAYDQEAAAPWVAGGAEQFSAERSQWRRPERGGYVRYRVRAYRGVIRRRVGRSVETDRCPHEHAKQAAARACAERAARRLNKGGDVDARSE